MMKALDGFKGVSYYSCWERAGIMRWPQSAFWLGAILATGVLANDVKLAHDNSNRQQCSGMYGKKAWGGDINPFILLRMESVKDKKDQIMSLVMFEWKDEDLIGRNLAAKDGMTQKKLICDAPSVDAKLCAQNELGSFILAPNATDKAKSPLISLAVNMTDPKPIKYPVSKSGFYCVTTYPFTDGLEYHGVVTFRNAYGELPATQVPKLPFYGGLTILYALMGVFWGFLYAQHRHDILPVQNYITAIIVFLVVEQLITWGFYDYQNRYGSNAVSKVLMVIVSILSAGRNSFSFFLLLIVCMGYGVVKPSLGRTMIYVRILAITHFVFGVIYSLASLSITPDSAGPLVLLVVLPLAGSLTAFYVWTLNSLSATMKDLVSRKQHVKAMMYKKLWWCLLGSIVVIFAFFFINSFVFASTNVADLIPAQWKSRWFVLDGWLNIVYLFNIAYVSYLWRPTANNKRFAMSDELAQEDDGFEIRSITDSLDEEDAVENTNGRKNDRSPAAAASAQANNGAHQVRHSLDGETIFAVGEDMDRWSDDDVSPRNSTERKKLMRKDD
ncbi:PTM1 [Arthroderma uncinatum]|uniref:PTM1 n=1 Tax=Arthroderma uncinatum TaxID=74035 RepID=UPI00144A93A4|nr:PTM1 [Arthroderma uncinatum]KAF3483449.1 PTM1 [Arthroderma uncinatum]